MAPTPWLPMLEANQGTISVVALVVALVAFVVELHRANTQQLRENEREIEDAITLVEELESEIELAAMGASSNADENFAIIGAALRGSAVAHVKKPLLSLHLMRCAHVAESASKCTAADLRLVADDMEDTLASAKSGIQEALIEAKRRIVYRRNEERKVHKALRAAIRESTPAPDA